jgi:ribosomal protein S4
MDKRSKLVRNMSPYALRLLEKQKLRFNYILLSVNYYVMLFKLRSQQVLQVKYYLNLEMRLDNIVYRLGMAPQGSSSVSRTRSYFS